MSLKHLAAIGYVAGIVAANYLTNHYGMIPVGFGIVATAGTYFAGASFVLRDAVQDTAGKRVVVLLILAGAVLSAAFSPALAVASGIAFLLSETADLTVYTPLRRRGYVRAAVASNVVGAVVDTFAFLWLAGFPVFASAPGQLIGKLWLTLAAVVLVGGARALLRQPNLRAGK